MGIFRGVRIYPIYWGKFGHYNLLGFSSSVDPFFTKICNYLPQMIAVQMKKTLGQTIHCSRRTTMQISQIRPKLPQLTVHT